MTKCLPILYHGVEACPVNKAQLQSLDFVLHSSIRKIFRTKSTNVVKNCMLMFGCSPAEEFISSRKDKFLAKYTAMDNVITGGSVYVPLVRFSHFVRYQKKRNTTSWTVFLIPRALKNEKNGSCFVFRFSH